jgi:hypothetical protein
MQNILVGHEMRSKRKQNILVECEEYILKERGTHLWIAKYTLKYTCGMRNTHIGRIKNTLV